MKTWIRSIEGIENFIEVEAKFVQPNICEILSNEYLDHQDATSIWEFFPGDVVLCKKFEGKLVARKLVSTKVKNRKLLELIFIVVKNKGQISSSLLKRYESEINFLKSNPDVIFHKHPVVRKWLLELH